MQLEPLLEEAGVGPEAQESLKGIFLAVTAGKAALDLASFTDVMVWLKVPDVYCVQYYKAFDLDANGSIDFREFVLGMTAMDHSTWHGKAHRTHRCHSCCVSSPHTHTTRVAGSIPQ